VHPLFPRSVEILCKEMGDGSFSRYAKIGCEGRDLLDSLGYHDRNSLNEQRKGIISDYIRALEKWPKRVRPETPIESKVFGFLGLPTESKVGFVEKFIHMTDSDEPSLSSLMKLTEDTCEWACKDFRIQAHAGHLGRPFNCFKCLSDAGGITKCQCCYSMLLDSGLLCAGTTGEVTLMLSEFRRFVEENILAYSTAINSWLKEESPKEAWLKDARYVFENDALEIVEAVRSSLGEKDEVKVWLAACLLKTVKDNQRWHKRTELIDDFPRATSWFREALQ